MWPGTCLPVLEGSIFLRIGRSGYVYVLGGGGEDRGRYIISFKGERDGEDIWESEDSDGRPIIQEIIKKAVSLKPGEMATVRYRWQNMGESELRWKIARLVYFAPWDWVIGTSEYEDELQTYHVLLSNGRAWMTRIMAGAGVVIALVVGVAGFFIAWSITRPIREMTSVVQKIAAGDLDHTVDVVSPDEIGVLAGAFNQMTVRLHASMAELRQSEEKYRHIFENAIEGLFQNTLDGRIINANPGLARILGYDSPEELINTIENVGQQLYVNSNEHDMLLLTIKRQGEVVDREVQFYCKNHEAIWVSISARIQAGEVGAAETVEGFLTDVTARKKAEEALAEFRGFLKEVFKLSRSAIPSNIAFSQDISETCPPVLINPTRMHQVAMNLIINGYHAVEQTGGKISICLKEVNLTEDTIDNLSLEPGRYVVFSVTDTGTGIDPAIVGKISSLNWKSSCWSVWDIMSPHS